MLTHSDLEKDAELRALAKGNDMTPLEIKQPPSRRDLARGFSHKMCCNCDLDRWQPERTTGHSHVCRIHKAAMAWNKGDPIPEPPFLAIAEAEGGR